MSHYGKSKQSEVIENLSFIYSPSEVREALGTPKHVAGVKREAIFMVTLQFGNSVLLLTEFRVDPAAWTTVTPHSVRCGAEHL